MYNEESRRDTAPRKMNQNKQANQKGRGTTDKTCRINPNTGVQLRMRTI